MNPNIKSFFQFAVAHDLRVLHDDRKLFEPGLQQHLQQRTIILDDIFELITNDGKPTVRSLGKKRTSSYKRVTV